nr:hypothetical protein Iba_chr12aCG17170 [Ipomoea batatas]
MTSWIHKTLKSSKTPIPKVLLHQNRAHGERCCHLKMLILLGTHTKTLR